MTIELAPYNIQVNAIVPEWFDKDMTVSIKIIVKFIQKLFLRSVSFGFHRLIGAGIGNFSWYLTLYYFYNGYTCPL